MNFRLTRYLAIIAVALLFSGSAVAAGVNVSVNFGNPPKGGGPCGGKGLCSAIAYNPNTSSFGTSVKFQLNPLDSTDLIMAFSYSDLKKKQPDQTANFVNGGSYYFDAAYYFDPVMFADDHLQTNARIDVTTTNWVEISGDLVKVHYAYAHD